MKKKVLHSILFIGMSCYISISFADSMADAVVGDSMTQDNSLAIDNTSNILATQVYIQKTYYSINDVINTLNLYNIKSSIIQQGNSNTVGYKITNSSNVQNFLNEICPKLGYTYNVNSNNVIIFNSIVPISAPKAILPVIIKPTPTPLPTPLKTNPSKVDTSTLLPINLKVESKPIESKPIINPYKPNVVVESQKYNSTWVMNVNDKTIKKTFEKWSKQSGWSIIWDSNYDFPIRSGMEVEGNLDYAINEVCRASTSTGVQMLATFAPKNKTIVITTPNI